MADTPFDFNGLDRYKAQPFLAGYPANIRRFYSPRDPGVHAVIVSLLKAAQHSVVLNMYGFDDDDADAVLREKMLSEHVYVQMSLDKSQAGGVHEKQLLAKWPAQAFGTSIAVGQSIKHAISHLKVCIVDGIYTVTGSTNWSLSGEQAQDNELTITNDPVLAAEARSILDMNHDAMLAAMAGAPKAPAPKKPVISVFERTPLNP